MVCLLNSLMEIRSITIFVNGCVFVRSLHSYCSVLIAGIIVLYILLSHGHGMKVDLITVAGYRSCSSGKSIVPKRLKFYILATKF